MPLADEQSRLEILKRIFEDATDPILVEDLSGIVITANREAVRVYGYSLEELVGRPIKTIVPEERHREADLLLQRCLSGEDVRNVQTVRRDKAGKTIPVLVTFSLLRDPEGQPNAVATFAKDITALQQIRERLEKERGMQMARDYRAVFLGESIAARALRESVEAFSQTDQPLLIAGPPGAGQTAVAQAVHHASSRGDNPFVFIDGTRFNTDQETSLFGAEDWEEPDGTAYLAHGGTLYIAHVEHLPKSTQWTLRDYLETAERMRKEGRIPYPDLRIIFYTRHDLLELSAEDRFDAELAEVIGRNRLTLPSLSERRSDIVEMANALLAANTEVYGKVVEAIDKRAQDRLVGYNWPGNIDELDAVIRQSVITTRNTTIEEMDIQILGGRRLGDYNLVRKLGEGGMGEVWLAKHAFLGRTAAVKLIRKDVVQNKGVDEEEVTVRFEREAKVTAMLRSPHTIQLYDFGSSADGGLYYVMEYLPGRDLDHLVQQYGPMAPERVVHFLKQAAYSLAEAHDAGLIHRDIKPSNIFSCRLGPYQDFTKIIDFGIVRSYTDKATRITKAHLFPGTPEFSAPEVVTNPNAMGPRADLYSLGCSAFFLLTGQCPFEGTSDWDIMMKHTTTPAAAPSTIRADVPAWADALVLELMAKSPEERPASAYALIEKLRALPIDAPWTERAATAWWDERGGRHLRA